MKYAIYCINLYERNDKYKFMKDQFTKHGLKVTFIRNYKHKNGGRYGCFESHIQVLIDAEEKDIDICLVFEDDCFIYDNPKYKINECLKFISENNIYLLKSNRSVTFYNIKNCIDNDTYFSEGVTVGNFCYFVNKTFRKIILQNYKKYINKCHVDGTYSLLCPREKYYVYNNYIVKLHPFASDNSPWVKNFILNDIMQYKIFKYNTDILLYSNNLIHLILFLMFIICDDLFYNHMKKIFSVFIKYQIKYQINNCT